MGQVCKATTAFYDYASSLSKGLLTNNLVILPLHWDAMPGTKRAVWLATQVICNDPVRPSPAGQMDKLLVTKP